MANPDEETVIPMLTPKKNLGELLSKTQPINTIHEAHEVAASPKKQRAMLRHRISEIDVAIANLNEEKAQIRSRLANNKD